VAPKITMRSTTNLLQGFLYRRPDAQTPKV
jgi:hypothetical protein